MSNQLKKVPHYLYHEGDHPQDVIVCLIGDKAWAYYDYGKGIEWGWIRDSLQLPHNYKPIIIGDEQLSNLNNLQLAKKTHSAFRFYECGNLDIIHKTALEFNLAKNTNAKTNKIPFHSNYTFDINEYEDLNEEGRLSTLEDDEVIKMVADSIQPPQEYAEYFKALEDSDKCQELLKELGGDLRVGNGSIYQYNGKYWEYLDSDGGLAKVIMKFFDEKGIKYSYRKIENLNKLLMLKLEPLGIPNIDRLGFNNGTLSKKEGKLLPHKKEDNLTTISPINYPDHKIPTPYFDDWLEWVTDGNEKKKDTILATFYAIATTRSEWHYFFEISGCGGSGKSTFHEIALMLVGRQNGESLPLESLGSRFGKANIMNKPYLFSTDQEYFKGDGGTLRAIVACDEIQIEQKNKNPVTYKPNAIYVCVTNSPCYFTERSGGIERRRVIILLNKEVPQDKRIIDLPQKLREEVGGILWLLINKFNGNPEIARQLLEEQKNSLEALSVKEQMDPLHSFVKEFKTVNTPSKECLKFDCRYPPSLGLEAEGSALYKAYLYWHNCQNIGRKPMDKTTFKEVITQVFKERGMKLIIRFKEYDHTWYTNVKYINKQQAFKNWEN